MSLEALEVSIQCLALVIYGEAGSASIENQRNIGYVYYRRADFNKLKVCDAVYSKHASQYITEIRIGKKKKPDNLTLLKYKQVAIDVMWHKVPTTTPKATHFHDTSVNPKWNLAMIKQVQNIKYYY